MVAITPHPPTALETAVTNAQTGGLLTRESQLGHLTKAQAHDIVANLQSAHVDLTTMRNQLVEFCAANQYAGLTKVDAGTVSMLRREIARGEFDNMTVAVKLGGDPNHAIDATRAKTIVRTLATEGFSAADISHVVARAGTVFREGHALVRYDGLTAADVNTLNKQVALLRQNPHAYLASPPAPKPTIDLGF